MGIEPTNGMSPYRSPVLKTGAGTSRTTTPVVGHSDSCMSLGIGSTSLRTASKRREPLIHGGDDLIGRQGRERLPGTIQGRGIGGSGVDQEAITEVERMVGRD